MEATTMISLTGVDLTGALNEVVALIPILLPTVVGFIAVRKGIAFIKSQLKGA